MTVTARIALVLGLVFLGGALATTFVPASPQGATCGNWVAPEWDREKTQDIVESARETYEGARAMGADGLAEDAYSIAANSAKAYELCSDALSTRRTLALILLAGAVVLPAAVLFIGRGRRPSSSRA